MQIVYIFAVMTPFTLYVVDDESSITEGIRLALEADYGIRTFADAESALSAIRATPPDLILLDIGLPGISGLDALAEIKKVHPTLPVIMITAYEDVDSVVTAMKQGAYDYIVKPLHMDGLEVTIQNALDSVRLRKEVHLLQARYLEENLPCFIGESRAILDVMEFIETVAKSPDTPILLVGETGTGKELLASSIHYRSPNFKGPLATVNCAAIPRDLIESELFGYEKGAFSGARPSGKKGLIEEAGGGTLFLDEVGDLSLEAQAKMLRFLEEGEFYRVGGTKKLQVATRLVSATNKDIDQMVERNEFRRDLYFRLGVIKVHIPSLNERQDDILLLAKHFLSLFNEKFNRNFTAIASDAEKALLKHKWTGNVRELKNLVERAVLTGRGPELSTRDLGLFDRQSDPYSHTAAGSATLPTITEAGVDITEIEKAMERYYLEEALRIAGGNESKAARLLNLNHHTYRYRRKKLLKS